VTWQDELRRLDEELASGRLAADDYRRQRDELLAQAASSGSGTPPPPGAPHPASGAPFPPPFRWEQAGSNSPRGDDTDEEPRTEAMHPRRPPHEDAERTQVVSGRSDRRHQGGQQPPPATPEWPAQPRPAGHTVPSWQQHEHSSVPPWQSGELPPTTDNTPAWFKQGPEMFEATRPSRGRQLFWLLLAVIVAVAAVGAVMYLVAFRPSESGGGAAATGAATPTPPPITTTRPQLTPLEAAYEKMPNPPGEQDADSGVLSLDRVSELKLLSAAEVEILRKARIEQVAFRSSIKGQDQYSQYPDLFEAVTFIAVDAGTAREVAGDLRAYQERNGLIHIPEPLPDMPASVVFEKSINPVRSVYRGLYVSGNQVVRLNVVQEPPKDEAALSGSYQRHIRELMTVFEPSQ
jgi:hypothetical protein